MSKPDNPPRPAAAGSAILRYGLSVVSVAISTCLTVLLEGFTFRTPLFFPAILLSTWFGGTGPGLLSVLLSVLSINFFLLEPKFKFGFGIHDIPHTISFLLGALLISWWSAARKRAEAALRDREEQLRKARDELEAKVAERTADLAQTNEQLRKEIGDRKRAEEQLRRAEAQARKVIDAIPQQIWSGPADGSLDYCNDQWRAFMGLGQEEIQGDGWQSMLHPDDRDRVLKAWRESVVNGTPYEQEERHRAADGTYRWFLCRGVPLRDGEGRIERWYGTNTDIEDRKRAEEALREQANLLNLTHDTIFVRNMNDAITYWNRGAEELYGWSRGQALGKISHELMQTVFPAPFEQIQAELLSTGRWEGELVHAKADGIQVVVASRWSLQRDEKGRPIAILETNNDMTRQKRAEEALRQAQADLAHVSRVTTMGELSASIAHEVGQPLTGVINNANACLGLLPDGTPNLEEVREALTEIIDDADRASAIILRVRQLSKRAPIEKSLLDLRDVVKDVLALARYELGTRRITIRTELPNGSPSVLGDRVQLQQVLLNLVMNGMDAMNSVEEQKRILVVFGKHETMNGMPAVLLGVRDSGVGLKTEEMDRLFEAFYTTKPQGMGMGLAISRSIVEAHGGRLWAEPNQGPGATFLLSLPAADK